MIIGSVRPEYMEAERDFMHWKRLLKIFGYILTGLVVCMILLISYLLLSPNYSLVNPTDDAMKPTFTKGDIAVFETSNTGKIRPGEVISFTYQEPGQAKISVTGRVVSLDKGLLVTKEDTADGKSSWEIVNVQVKGDYLFKLPLLGYIVRLANGGRGKYWLIALGSLAFLAIFLFEFLGSVKARKRGGAEQQPETS
jgi:signal peptidase I